MFSSLARLQFARRGRASGRVVDARWLGARGHGNWIDVCLASLARHMRWASNSAIQLKAPASIENRGLLLHLGGALTESVGMPALPRAHELRSFGRPRLCGRPSFTRL